MYKDNSCENALSRGSTTGDRSNKCNQCDFSSVHARALRIHMKIHTMGKNKQMQ